MVERGQSVNLDGFFRLSRFQVKEICWVEAKGKGKVEAEAKMGVEARVEVELKVEVKVKKVWEVKAKVEGKKEK
jgi:hypothetical protein